MPAGRPTKYRKEYCEAVVHHMAEGASLASFAAQIDVCRATINVWMDEYPEFLEATRKAKAKCAAWWEEQARRIAMEGGGPGAGPMTMFGLKNMAADDWRDRQEVDHRSQDGSMSPQRIEIVGGSQDTDGTD